MHWHKCTYKLIFYLKNGGELPPLGFVEGVDPFRIHSDFHSQLSSFIVSHGENSGSSVQSTDLEIYMHLNALIYYRSLVLCIFS